MASKRTIDAARARNAPTGPGACEESPAVTAERLRVRYRQLLEERRPHQARTPEEDVRECERLDALLAEVRTAIAERKDLSLAERAALAAHEGMAAREGSYDRGSGAYARTTDECIREACEARQVPDSTRGLLHIASVYSNDLADWADDILAGTVK